LLSSKDDFVRVSYFLLDGRHGGTKRPISQLITIAIQERRHCKGLLVPLWWQALGIFAYILSRRMVGAGVPVYIYTAKHHLLFLFLMHE